MEEDPRTRITRALMELVAEEGMAPDTEMVGDWVVVIHMPDMTMKTDHSSYSMFCSTPEQPSHVTQGLLIEGRLFHPAYGGD